MHAPSAGPLGFALSACSALMNLESRRRLNIEYVPARRRGCLKCHAIRGPLIKLCKCTEGARHTVGELAMGRLRRNQSRPILLTLLDLTRFVRHYAGVIITCTISRVSKQGIQTLCTK